MLENWFWNKQLNTEDFRKYHFQQIGVTPHDSYVVQKWLSNKFSEKCIQKKNGHQDHQTLILVNFFKVI